MRETDVLMEFMSYPVNDAGSLLSRFASLDGAIREGSGPEQFVYIRGLRDDKVLLVAHSDTVWEGMMHSNHDPNPGIILKNGIIRSRVPGIGIGADDRAGCAMLWLLKDLGHSLLVTAGEETGLQGAGWLMRNRPDIAAEINDGHCFAVEFDLRKTGLFKCYDVGTDEFRLYVSAKTGYKDAGRNSFTDIVALCKEIPGVNLSAGYYNPHSDAEFLVVSEWIDSYNTAEQWLSQTGLPRFELVKEIFTEL
ncbi:MAG TPA: hypothetical protein VK155_10375 [Bacteroidales bacterium]|jgi:hypothetical protein|nr:hypothetical protein [Bacteroidales bacterium]